MRSRMAILAVLMLTVAPLAAAAAGEPLPLSFADAVKIALQQNPAYLASATDVAGAKARVRAARGPLAPSFTLSDTYQLQTPVAQLQTPFGSLPFAPNSTNVPLAMLGYTLADGGLTAARIARADAQLAGARASQRAAATATIGRVAASYYELVAALGSAEVAERSVGVSNDHARLVRQRLDAGIAPRADLLQAQTQFADARVQLINARNAVDRASESLDAAMGVSLDTRYRPTDALEESAQIPALSAMLSAARESRGELAASRDAIRAARDIRK
jgi:outer membrane protein